MAVILAERVINRLPRDEVDRHENALPLQPHLPRERRHHAVDASGSPSVKPAARYRARSARQSRWLIRPGSLMAVGDGWSRECT
jgi:hypothetical protein